MSLLSPDKHSQHLEASPALLLDKPLQLPPAFLQGTEGDSCSWNAQGQGASLRPPVEPQPPGWPRHDAAASQEPLSASGSHLGNAWGSGSTLTSTPPCSLEQSSDSGHLSSGYAGDEENSEASLVGSRRIVRVNRRLDPQAGGTHTSPRKSLPASPAHRTQQTGGEK